MMTPFKYRPSAILSALLLAALAGFFSCKKVEPERQIIVKTGSYSEVTINSCLMGGTLLDVGANGISDHGFEIGLSGDLSGEDTRTIGMGPTENTGVFSKFIEDLEPGKTYYVRAFATSGNNKKAGTITHFNTQTISFPEIQTGEVTYLTPWYAEILCTLISNGGSDIVEQGICWATHTDPAIDDNKTVYDYPGASAYEGICDQLIPNTHYFARAYATNDAGTAYGMNVEFMTPSPPEPPVVETHAVYGIDETFITCGGNILSNGGAPIVEKGLCWSAESSDPNVDDHESYIYGGGDESFELQITGLTHYTEYFIRAYANNGGYTSYGEPIRFRTKCTCGQELIDPRDGQAYPTVQIGEQCWMAKNLNVGNWVEISDGQHENLDIEKFCYADNAGNCDAYGGLYTWNEMMQYSMEESAQGVCPEGWHIPSDGEWMDLERAQEMNEADLDLMGQYRGLTQGAKLKSPDPAWNGLNTSGFSALPSGMIFTDNLSSTGMGDFTVFWTSTPTQPNRIYRMLHSIENGIGRMEGDPANTSPVRCVRD